MVFACVSCLHVYRTCIAARLCAQLYLFAYKVSIFYLYLRAKLTKKCCNIVTLSLIYETLQCHCLILRGM